MIGMPIVIYVSGMQYFVTLMAFPISIVFMNFVVVPIFVENQLKTGLQVKLSHVILASYT